MNTFFRIVSNIFLLTIPIVILVGTFILIIKLSKRKRKQNGLGIPIQESVPGQKESYFSKNNLLNGDYFYLSESGEYKIWEDYNLSNRRVSFINPTLMIIDEHDQEIQLQYSSIALKGIGKILVCSFSALTGSYRLNVKDYPQPLLRNIIPKFSITKASQKTKK